MEYEEILGIAASHSDHRERVVEIKPALEDALRNTSPIYPVLEIGNREGGSALLIMWHLYIEARGRGMVTVDIGKETSLITEWKQRLRITAPHFISKQRDYVKGMQTPWAFVYLDADHNEASCVEDLQTFSPHMVPMGIVAVDDVHEWKSLPIIEGMLRIAYPIDQGLPVGASHGQHIAFWRKL